MAVSLCKIGIPISLLLRQIVVKIINIIIPSKAFPPQLMLLCTVFIGTRDSFCAVAKAG